MNRVSPKARCSLKTVGMVLRRERPRAVAIAHELTTWLHGRHLTTLAEPRSLPSWLRGGRARSRDCVANLIVVLGGDGTLLSIARLVGERETPILGINLGGLGFLTEITTEEAQAALARVVAGDYEVDRRITLEATVESHVAGSVAADCESFRALNDVVMNKRALGRMLELNVVASGERFCSYRADGLIIRNADGLDRICAQRRRADRFSLARQYVVVLAPIGPHTLRTARWCCLIPSR